MITQSTILKTLLNSVPALVLVVSLGGANAMAQVGSEYHCSGKVLRTFDRENSNAVTLDMSNSKTIEIKFDLYQELSPSVVYSQEGLPHSMKMGGKILQVVNHDGVLHFAANANGTFTESTVAATGIEMMLWSTDIVPATMGAPERVEFRLPVPMHLNQLTVGSMSDAMGAATPMVFKCERK